MNVVVVGGGIFGVTGARQLAKRGHRVTLCDPGPLPHPLAESTDVSKVIRCDYGSDLEYTQLGERSLEGWRRWNERFARPLFHETGVMFLSRTAMTRGGFEHDSFELLRARGHRIERIDARALARRFPAYRFGAFADGYFHADGGWAESAAVVAEVACWAARRGVTIRANCRVTRIVDDGVVIGDDHLAADIVVVGAGSGTPRLVPELAGALRAIGQPVFHFRPADPRPFEAARFPVFGADIAATGYYGFPLAGGVVKIANHGAGRAIPPAERDTADVTEAEREHVRAFLDATFPALADAPITHTRCCVYGDSVDGHFWIAPHPQRANLIVAAGGSGHAFKFAPVLGDLIADAVDGRVVDRFRWRPELTSPARGDAARHQ